LPTLKSFIEQEKGGESKMKSLFIRRVLALGCRPPVKKKRRVGTTHLNSG